MSVGATDPMIGRLIDGRYQVRSRIARGGMATVYLATDLRLERRVAVKIMHGHLADDSQFKQRFIQEARSAARLAHPNVVNVFDQGQDSESAYLVMEYLPGITLRDLLEEYGSLTAQQTVDISEAVLSGLAAAHKAGIIHRDLKPENVLLADDGRIKIGDFGLARAASTQTATGAQLLGTIAYLSPELVTRGVADTRSDIYAVGIMMYEMLTGEQPFTGEQPMQIAYRHANEPVPAPSVKNARVPREIDELVRWATEKDPDARPADARALLDQLRDTESLLDLGSPGDTTAIATRVLPPAPARRRATGPTTPTAAIRPAGPFADAETQVLGSRRAAAGELERVAVRAPSSRRRRWIPLVAGLAILALIGGTVGWWFGLGPGASVTIPTSLVGVAEGEARGILADLELAVAERNGEVFSPEIAAGAVAETEPALGESVAKGTVVTLYLSKGPEPFPIAFTAGMPRADAEQMAQEHFRMLDPDVQFHAAIERDQLIDALADDGSSLLGVAEYGDQREITLVLSAGPVPDVAGQDVDAASGLLEQVGLTVDAGGAERAHSDDVAQDLVIGLVPVEGILRPGDSVRFVISDGPAPTDVPAIVGMTWNQARESLIAAGLGWRFARTGDRILAENIPNEATVTSVDPGAGTTVTRKDVVTVRLSPS